MSETCVAYLRDLPAAHASGGCVDIRLRLFSSELRRRFEFRNFAVTPSGALWIHSVILNHSQERSVHWSCWKADASEEEADSSAQRRNAAIHLLESWRGGDQQEQRNTWEYLRIALDEDRLSDRRLFP